MRLNKRKRKRVQYNEDDGSDDDDEEEEEEECSEPLGPSTQDTHIQRTPDKKRSLFSDLLPVTCGSKKGLLDVEKLASGEACIESEGCWFAPPAFEEFAGRGCSKKWKTTIFFENKPLQFWLEQGSLRTPGFIRRKAASKKQKKTPSPNSESESRSEESKAESEEEVEEDDEKDEDWHPGGGSAAEELAAFTEEEEEEVVGDEHGGEDEDSGGDRQSEGEDKMATEDEDTPAAAAGDDDNRVFEGEKGNWFILTGYEELGEKSGAKQRSCLEIPVKRFPVAKRNLFPSNCTGHPVLESSCMPLDEDGDNGMETIHYSEEERGEEEDGSAKDDASVTAHIDADANQMSSTPIFVSSRGVEENGEEEMERLRGKEGSQRGEKEVNTETVISATPLSMPAVATQTSPPDVKPNIHNAAGDSASTSNQTPNLSSCPLLSVSAKDTNVLRVNTIKEHEEITENQEETEDGELQTEQSGEQERQGERREAGTEMERGQRRCVKSGSEGNGQAVATGNTNDNLPTNTLLPKSQSPCLPSSIPNLSASHCSAQVPHNPKKKTHSFSRKRKLRFSGSQYCGGRDKAQDRRRERREIIMVNSLQKISDSQHKITTALEQLCSSQNTVIELLQKMSDKMNMGWKGPK
ncbi:eukaryotic translation initiation factor 5B-like [Centroberyx affinis]|uniref:eukaryotic translation initiation factor 5B-like n=1 Tax=Centroberyx affinis TaxID=166261 RepID=UPI003A5C6475